MLYNAQGFIVVADCLSLSLSHWVAEKYVLLDQLKQHGVVEELVNANILTEYLYTWKMKQNNWLLIQQ